MKKNLEQLFKERLDNFEAVPGEHVWENIEERLREKKKRRIIPIWWKLAGVAATLLIGFLTFDHYTQMAPIENRIVVAPMEESVKPTLDNPDDNKIDTRKSVDENGVLENDSQNGKIDNSGAFNDKITPSANRKAVVKTQTKSNESSVKRSSKLKDITRAQKDAVANSESGEKFGDLSKSDNAQIVLANKNKKTVKLIRPSGNELAEKPSDAISKTTKDSFERSINGNSMVKGSAKNQIADVSKSQNSEVNVLDKKAISREAETENNTDNKIALVDSKDLDKGNTTNIDKDIKILDSISAVAVAKKVEPNALEELLNEKENNQNAPEPKINRWQVSSNVAPIYLSSISNGSPINSEFANNPKEYENNLSYGVGVNYAVGKKLSLRTGVNRFTLGYNTKDVVAYAGVESKNMKNIKLTAQNQNISIEDKGPTQMVTDKPTLDAESETTKYSGVLNQQMGYVEVPLEMTYKLIDQKFGLNIIGGFSTLFLDKNEVSVVSNGLISEIGQANNLNKIHMSTNVGVGMHYNIYKSIRINVEPMFKYQMNSFSNDSGSFKPYFFGIYSGVGFTF